MCHLSVGHCQCTNVPCMSGSAIVSCFIMNKQMEMEMEFSVWRSQHWVLLQNALLFHCMLYTMPRWQNRCYSASRELFSNYLSTLTVCISGIGSNIDKRNAAFSSTVYSTSNAKNLVNLDSLTTKFCCVISNHLSSTLPLLHLYKIMQLRLGHVTWLRT